MNGVVEQNLNASFVDAHRQFISAITYALTLTLTGMWLAGLFIGAEFLLKKQNPFGNIWHIMLVGLVTLILLNGSFLLMPIVDQVSALAHENLVRNLVPAEYIELKAKEDIFGAANFLMALLVLLFSYFKPIKSN